MKVAVMITLEWFMWLGEFMLILKSLRSFFSLLLYWILVLKVFFGSSLFLFHFALLYF